MVAKKLVSFVFGLGVLLYWAPRLLGITMGELVPEEIRYVGFGIFMLLGLYVAFKLSRYIAAPAEDRIKIRQDFARWFLPMSGYGERAQDEAVRDLVVRESRAVMILQALTGVFPFIIILLINTQMNLQPFPFLFFLGIGALILLSSIATLAQALIADELVVVSTEGLRLPYHYRSAIDWEDIYTVELRNRGKHGFQLYVHFKDPDGPSMWRGIWGKVKGHFAHQNHEGTVKVDLKYADTEPYDIRAAIDHHLAARDMEVVVPSFGISVKSLFGEKEE